MVHIHCHTKLNVSFSITWQYMAPSGILNPTSCHISCDTHGYDYYDCSNDCVSQDMVSTGQWIKHQVAWLYSHSLIEVSLHLRKHDNGKSHNNLAFIMHHWWCMHRYRYEWSILPSKKCCQYPVILDRKLPKVGAIMLRDLTNVMVLLHTGIQQM